MNQCFFDNVRVPASARIGPENEAAAVLSERLADERTMSFGGRESRLLLSRLIHRLSVGDEDDVTPSDRVTLGRLVTDLEVERLLNVRAGAMAGRGEESSVAGSINKIFSSETSQRIAEWMSEVLPAADRTCAWGDGSCDRLAADAEWFVRGTVTVTIAGGTSEIQRNAVATRGLGLPKGS